MRLAKDEHPFRLVFVGVILTLTYLTILFPSGFLEGARLRSGDVFFRWRNALLPAPPQAKELLLVTIDEESQRKLGKKWPWDRSLLAESLTHLSQHQPRMVLFDLVLSGTSQLPHDQALAQAIQQAPPVLLACYLDRRGDPVLPLALFTEAGGKVGLINKPRDVDLTVRKLFAGIRIPLQREPLYAIEVQSAVLAHGILQDQVRLDLKSLQMGSLKIPLELPETMPINYLVGFHEIPSLSFWKIVQGEFLPETIQNKIILLGSASEITHDVYPTPLGLMPGVMISANGIITLLSGQFIKSPPLFLTLPATLLFVIGILLLTYRLPILWGILSTFTITLAVTALGFLLLALFNYRVESLSILLLSSQAWLAGILYRYLLLVSSALHLYRSVIIDPVSQAHTGRYLRLRMEARWPGRNLKGNPCGLLVIQIPPPSQMLEREDWSHVQKRIRQIAQTIRRLQPKGALFGRLGEDRFGLFLPHANLQQAKRWAEQIQREAASEPIALGLACSEQDPISTVSALVAGAESAAKRAESRNAPGSLEIFDAQKDSLFVQAAPKLETGTSSDDHLKYIANELEERNQALEKALSDLRKAHKDMEGNFLEVTKTLVLALETKDEYTAGHLERVSRYSTRLAEALGLPAEEIESIREAALLHDIGKIGLPDAILHKVGPLTEEEKGVIKQHLSLGAKILGPMKFFKPITTLIYHHHERYDGKGYPHGLTGDFIPSGAQVISIADSFDAMTTHRGYNKPLSAHEALSELRRGSGTQFNPNYLETFVKLIEKEGPQLAGYTPPLA